ncbi:MAG TPA: hypothetical protein VES73_07275, partial [Lamprocystis sp. (in: g-proteobacteria)]|nr:hypothetical protein [Lamprocystis sp. (in: g-proteobacteria)]
PGPVDLEALARDAIVDPLLPGYARAGGLAVYVLTDRDADGLASLLAGRPGKECPQMNANKRK